jgi:hypothetical protein
LLIACATRSDETTTEPEPQSKAECLEPVAEGCALHRVPLRELLAQPSQWRGRRVAVEGYLHLEQASGALYPSAEDYRRQNRRMALLTANFLRDVLGPKCKCNDQDVVITGMYDPSDKGGEAVWGGAVKDIEAVQPKQN